MLYQQVQSWQFSGLEWLCKSCLLYDCSRNKAPASAQPLRISAHYRPGNTSSYVVCPSFLGPYSNPLFY